MLIDDNDDDNFFHEREIKKNNSENVVIVMNSAIDAIEYLKHRKETNEPHPDMIFLDINMPMMNGWEFLEQYNQLDKELHSKAIVIMLTTSQNPDDEEKARAWNFVVDYVTKPLTNHVMDNMSSKYFQ